MIYGQNMINKYTISKKSQVVNIKEMVSLENNKFYGKIYNDYDIEYNEEILDGLKEKEDFDKIILYESMIYRKDTYSSIRKQLEQDCVKLSINHLTKNWIWINILLIIKKQSSSWKEWYTNGKQRNTFNTRRIW